MWVVKEGAATIPSERGRMFERLSGYEFGDSGWL